MLWVFQVRMASLTETEVEDMMIRKNEKIDRTVTV